MISHVVLMKPRADLAPAERRAFVDVFEQALREIPAVRGVRIGRRVVHGAGYEAVARDGFEYLAMIDFDDLAGLQAYLTHPAHEALAAQFRQTLSSAAVYDFEVWGVEGLRSIVD